MNNGEDNDPDYEIWDEDVEEITIGLMESEVPKNMIFSIHSPDEAIIISSEIGCEYMGEHNATVLLHDILRFISDKKDVLEKFKINIQVNPR